MAHDSIARALQMIAEDCGAHPGIDRLCTKLKACQGRAE